MIRRDYILKMIEELGRILRRMRNKVDAQEYGEASADLDEAFTKLIGSGAESVSKLSETELLARVTQDEATLIVRQKTMLLIDVLQEAGRLYAAQGREEESNEALIKALNLLLTLQLRDYELEAPELVPKIDLLRSQLSEVELPLRTQAGLWRYYERLGAYGKSEDALFAILKSEPANPNLISEAKAFYERLLRLNDETLAAGDLPRAEVKAGLAEVNALAT
jgi:tetratricopeptide (TPR) repeat protein